MNHVLRFFCEMDKVDAGTKMSYAWSANESITVPAWVKDGCFGADGAVHFVTSNRFISPSVLENVGNAEGSED